MYIALAFPPMRRFATSYNLELPDNKKSILHETEADADRWTEKQRELAVEAAEPGNAEQLEFMVRSSNQ